MISVDEFLRDAKPKSRSKLLPFKENIFTLKEADLSNKKICEFLKLNGVDVSHQRVAAFLKEQGFNLKNQRSHQSADHGKLSTSENHISERKEGGHQNLQPDTDFAKPRWVPKHINIQDLK